MRETTIKESNPLFISETGIGLRPAEIPIGITEQNHRKNYCKWLLNFYEQNLKVGVQLRSNQAVNQGESKAAYAITAYTRTKFIECNQVKI